MLFFVLNAVFLVFIFKAVFCGFGRDARAAAFDAGFAELEVAALDAFENFFSWHFL